MSISPIKALLERFKNFSVPNESIRKKVSEIVKNKIDIEIDIKDIEYRNGVVVVREHGAIKNEIFLNKKEILESLKEDFGEKSPKDIR